MRPPLSQVVRAGSALAPKQAFGALFRFRSGKPVAACALGAALLGAKVRSLSSLTKLYPELKELALYPTNPTGQRFRLEGVITFLNDYEKRSCRRIADWLESLGY